MEEKTNANTKKIYEQWWFWLIIVAIILIIAVVVVFAINTPKSNQMNSTISSSGDAQKTITDSNGREILKSDAKPSADNIEFEAVGITEYGDFVVKITNKNKVGVCITDNTVIFKDANGVFQKSENLDGYFIAIPANGTTYNYISGYKSDFSVYPKYEFNCEIANISDMYVYENISIESADTGEQLAVTFKNNTTYDLEYTRVIGVFYRDNTIVGIEDGYSNNVIKAGKEGYMNIDYPKNKSYDNVIFDKFEVYYISGSIKR